MFYDNDRNDRRGAEEAVFQRVRRELEIFIDEIDIDDDDRARLTELVADLVEATTALVTA